MAAMLAAIPAMAQVTTSPYSMYGYGLIRDHASSMQRQMGSVGYAMNSGRQINVMNPASYCMIDSLTFLFDLGADMAFLHSKEKGATENSIGGGVDYVTMQFPISDFMGGSIGLLPYSSVGYAFGNEISHGTLENNGTGGINQLYAGVSGKVGGFSLGANISYDFGTIVNDVYLQPSGSGQVKFEHVMRLRDWNVNVGAQFTHKWNRFNKLIIGATWSPKKTMLGNTWVTRQNTSEETYPDTVGYMKMKGKYYNPTTIGAGISYTFEKQGRLMVEADVTWQDWSNAPYSALVATNNPKEVLQPGMQFYDRTRYAVGAEYTPRLRGKYYERMVYRLGAYYTDDYLNINGNRMREYSISAGVGLPTFEGKSLVNLGVEWKKRNAHPNPLISESYFNITLGINFNEVWFWQRKIR